MNWIDTATLSHILPYVIALGVGFIVGIEREASHPVGEKALGVRSFTLLALLGSLINLFQFPVVVAGIVLIAGAIVVSAYLQTSHVRSKAESGEIGATTEIAALVVFVLGYVAHIEPMLASILGTVTLLVLLSRKPLHYFSRHQLKPQEIQAAAVLLILALGVLPLLPKEPIDPWHVVNVQRFGEIVVLLAFLQFLGYVGMRLFGERRGLLVTGLFSGFISSTVAFLTLPRLVHKNRQLTVAASASALMAVCSSFAELSLLVGVTAVDLFYQIAFVLGVSISIGIIAAVVLMRYSKSSDQQHVTHKNPLSLWGAFKLGILLFALLVGEQLVQQVWGNWGTQVLTFVVGLLETHAVSLAVSTLYTSGELTVAVAVKSLYLAMISGLLFKIGILYVLDRGRLALLTSVPIFLMMVPPVIGYFLY